MRKIITGLTAAVICVGTNAQDVVTPDELNTSRGVNFATAEIRTETIASGLHVLFGVGGNVLASRNWPRAQSASRYLLSQRSTGARRSFHLSMSTVCN